MLRGDFGGGMKRIAITCGAVAIALACIAPKQAAAGDNFVPALFGGLALGTLFGIAAASPPPVYYAPAPVYYAPHPCTFQAATGPVEGRCGTVIEEYG